MSDSKKQHAGDGPSGERRTAAEGSPGDETPSPDAAGVERKAAEEDGRSRDRRGVRSVTRALRALKAGHAAERTELQRFADQLTRWASSAAFFSLHVVWFAVWIVWNVGGFNLEPFDPFPFGLLTMIVSLEAIFLTMFVLMAQSRESAIAELREELTLQVNLRVEQEVTKTLQLVAGLYTRMGFRVADDPELVEMLKPLDPDMIEKELLEQIHDSIHYRRQTQ